MNKWPLNLVSNFFNKSSSHVENSTNTNVPNYDLMHFKTDDKQEKISSDAMKYSQTANISKTNYKNHSNSYDDNLISFSNKKNIEEASVSNTSKDMTISFNKNKVDRNEIFRG